MLVFLPFMPALCSLRKTAYFAGNYARIIAASLARTLLGVKAMNAAYGHQLRSWKQPDNTKEEIVNYQCTIH